MNSKLLRVFMVICMIFVLTFADMAVLVEFANTSIAVQLKGKEIDLQYQADVEKYVQYQIGDKKGILLQVKITTDTIGKDSQMSITERNLEVEKIKLDGQSAKEIIVLNSEGNKINYETLENDHIKIDYDNGESKAEYKMIYLFGEEMYNEYQKEYTISVKGKTNVKLLQGEETATVAKEFEEQKTLKEKIGEIVSYSIVDDEEQNIYKGYMYANAISGSTYATNYEVKTEIEVSARDMVDSVELSENTDLFMNTNGDKVSSGTNIVFKSISITKANFVDILGEQGYIEICDAEGNFLARLTATEEASISATYETTPSSIQIKTSDPIKEGTLKLHHQKSIVASAGFNEAQIQSFVSIERNVEGKYYQTIQKTIEVQEPVENIQVPAEETQEKVESENTNTQEQTPVENENPAIQTNEFSIQGSDKVFQTSQTAEGFGIDDSKKANLNNNANYVTNQIAENTIQTENITNTVENTVPQTNQNTTNEVNNTTNTANTVEQTNTVADSNTSNTPTENNEPIMKTRTETVEEVIEVGTYKATGYISLKETQTKVDLSISNINLSTEMINEVTITARLRTDEEKYDLFKNPEIEICLPKEVQTLEVSNINLLYKNGLSMENWEVSNLADGRKRIHVKLSGTQIQYMPGSIQEGTSIVIVAKIGLDKIVANKTTNIELKYTNEAARTISYQAEGKECNETQVKIVSRSGLIKASTIKNYNQVGESITSINDDTQVVNIAMNEPVKNVDMTGTVINNYEKAIDGVEIIGRVPFKGNQDLNGNALGSTLDTTMTRGITVTGKDATVYYSTEEQAVSESTSWVDYVEDVSTIKSYKIVVNGPLAQGEQIVFDYGFRVPENLSYNQVAYASYGVHYLYGGQIIVENSNIGVKTEEKETSMEDCNTQEQTELVKIGTKVTKGGIEVAAGEEVPERQMLKYEVVATNISNQPLTNVILKVKTTNANMYYLKEYEDENLGKTWTVKNWVEDTEGQKEYETITLPVMQPGESKTIEYQVVVKDITEENTEIASVAVFSADGIDEKTIELQKNPVVKADVELKVALSSNESINGDGVFYSGSSFSPYILIKNKTNKEIKDVDISLKLSKNIEYDIDKILYGRYDGYTVSETSISDGNQVTIHIPEIFSNAELKIFLLLYVEEFDYLIEKEKIQLCASTNIEEKNYISNQYEKEATQNETILETQFVGNKESGTVLQDKDEIIFSLTIENAGIIDSNSIMINELLGNGLKMKQVNIYNNNILENTVNTSHFGLELKSKEKKKIDFITEIDANEFSIGQQEISNQLEIQSNNGPRIQTNVVKYSVINNKKSSSNLLSDQSVNPPVSPSTDEEENNEINIQVNDNSNQTNNNNNNNNNNQTNNQNLPNTDQKNTDNSNNSDNTNNTSNNNYIYAPDTSNLQNLHSINGQVWFDTNKNGIKENSENFTEGLKIKLYSASDGEKIINLEGNAIETQTDKEGKYTFDNLKQGSYIVVFEYDTNIYKTTEYKSQQASESTNSDVIEKDVNISGETKTIGLSDIIDIADSDIMNIDMGLIEKDQFDFKLEKYVSKITVKNQKENQTYTYGKDDFARVDLTAKYINKTQLTVEYTILVTNEGDITGYVNQIVDYMPEGLSFDESQNQGWKQGEDGNLYYVGMLNQAIQPGKAKEIKLVLTKNMDGNATGTYTNEAEIYELTNALQVQDRDSIQGNKIDTEDDYDKVDLVVGIKTGIIFLYIFITLTVLIILATGTYLIKRKVLYR